MFNYSDYEFLKNDMKIVVDSIELKFEESPFKYFKSMAADTISKSIDIIRKERYNGGNNSKEAINSLYGNLIKSFKNNEVKEVFDTLRLSFLRYSSGGLQDLYIYQENEDWHPKMVLTEVMKPNGNDTLDEILTIYRGCDITEYENRSFGQAWTTSLEIAKAFAHTHYSDKKWFNDKKRVVLEATYRREHVLFSQQSREFEVVIDTNKLGCVRKHMYHNLMKL